MCVFMGDKPEGTAVLWMATANASPSGYFRRLVEPLQEEFCQNSPSRFRLPGGMRGLQHMASKE
jgi:hypothetical protein